MFIKDSEEVLHVGYRWTLNRGFYSMGEHRISREYVTGNDGVLVVPLTSDLDVVAIRQFRTAQDELVVEFPAGDIERGEAPEEAGTRELEEEVGLKAQNLVFLKSYLQVPGFLTSKIHIYLATSLTALPPKHHLANSVEENLATVIVQPLHRMLESGLQDMKSQVALDLVHKYLNTAAGRNLMSDSFDDLTNLRGAEPIFI